MTPKEFYKAVHELRAEYSPELHHEHSNNPEDLLLYVEDCCKAFARLAEEEEADG